MNSKFKIMIVEVDKPETEILFSTYKRGFDNE
jgi:hypothetical protein